MLLLSTAAKIRVARVLSRLLLVGRRLAGKRSPWVTCQRRGIAWHLDLRQGIDLSIYLFGQFEGRTSRALRRAVSPGMVVVDVGANIGAHTLPLARQVGPSGRVLAIEPSDYGSKRLNTHLELNPDLARSVTAVQAFVAERAMAKSPDVYASWNVISPDGHGTHRGQLCSTHGARTDTLDRLAADSGAKRIDLIKLDVDGHEVAVLGGAGSILKQHKPIIVLELCPYALREHGASLAELVGILHDHGYTLFEESGRRQLPLAHDRLERRIPSHGSINAMAVS